MQNRSLYRIGYPGFGYRNSAAPFSPGMSKYSVAALRNRNSPVARPVRRFVFEEPSCAVILLADLNSEVPHGIEVPAARTADGLAAYPDCGRSARGVVGRVHGREDDDGHGTTDNVLEGLHQVDSHFIASTRTFLRKNRAIRLRLEAANALARWSHYQKSFDARPIGMKSFCLQLVSGMESLRLIGDGEWIRKSWPASSESTRSPPDRDARSSRSFPPRCRVDLRGGGEFF